ncbi:MAG: STT3 domain-containing protein, partial [Candidatus Pacearchaeota archaeon]
MEENNLGTSKIEEEKIQKLDEEIIQEKKNNLIKFLKEKYLWISYFILGVIIYISLFIRTRNINNLKDITTSEWTLGPDLDPFLFLRWAEYIVENGKLFLIDNMRYIPLGYNTFGESRLLSYMIAWFHNFLSMLPEGIVKILPGKPSEITITYSAVIFPVFMFGLTIIAFFLLTREIFKDSFKEKIYPNSIALVASFFLSTIPIILPRTIAGIPEKESVGFLFIFLSFYFLIKSFKSKNYKKIITYGIIAGISTAILGLIWGGIIFVFYSTGIAVFIIYILGKMNKNMLLAHFTWIITFMPIIMYFSTRYPLKYFTSITIIPIYATLLFSIVDIYFYEKLLKINYI